MQGAAPRKKRITRRNLRAIQAPKDVRDSQPLMAWTPLLEEMATSMGMGLAINDSFDRALHTSTSYSRLMDESTRPLLENTIALRFDGDEVRLRLLAPDDRDEKYERLAKKALIAEISVGLAHDFRNLLTVIMGNLELLKTLVDGKRSLPSSGKQAGHLFHEIESAAEMGLGLCGRIEGLGTTKRKVRTENLVTIVESAVGLIQRVVKEESNRRKLKISLENNATESMMVNVVSAEVQMAIINILLNATRYCGADGEEGKIALDSYQTKGHAILTIWNNGPPIPPEMKNHLLRKPLAAAADHGYGLYTAAANLRDFDAILSFTSGADGPTFQMTFPISRRLI